MDAYKISDLYDKKLDKPYYNLDCMDDIYANALKYENEHRSNPNYMKEVQPRINEAMRMRLLDWTMEVSNKLGLTDETFFLSVYYLDKFLSYHTIHRQQLQVYGMACLLIAMKYNESLEPPHLKTLVYYGGGAYNKHDLILAEGMVLNVLGFNCCIVTELDFLTHYARAMNSSEMTYSIAKYALELCLLSTTYLKYKPSCLTACAVYLAHYITNRMSDYKLNMSEKYTHYSYNDMEECLKDMCKIKIDVNKLFIAKKYNGKLI